MPRGNNGLVHTLLAGAATLALSIPAQAVVVQYTADVGGGLGDLTDMVGGGTVTDNAANGLPACEKGMTRHFTANVPAAGYARIGTVGVAKSIMLDGPAGVTQGGVSRNLPPFAYGTVVATTGAVNTNNFPLGRVIGAAGTNGAAQYSSGTCAVTYTPVRLGTNLPNRTHMTGFTWPHRPSNLLVRGPNVISGMLPGGTNFTFTTTATDLASPAGQDLTLCSGCGFALPGTWNGTAAVNGFSHFGPPGATTMQVVRAFAGTRTFGGGARGTGGGRIDLGAVTGGLGALTGFWLSGPRVLGHGHTATKTLTPTAKGLFTHIPAGFNLPVTLRVVNFAYTTGQVVQSEFGGAYNSERTETGFDARNAAGTVGNLQLISPWNGLLTTLSLGFGGTGHLNFNFAPEPGSTGLLAAGIVSILMLHRRSRKR